MPVRPRPEIESIEACVHGSPDYAELASAGLTADKVLDFSVCCNPYPPPAAVRKSLTGLAIGCYPDSESGELRQALSGHLGIAQANILAGSGTTELIRLIALAYFGRGDKVIILKPTYGEYELACRLAGANIIEHVAKESDNFRFDANEIAKIVRRNRPKGIFICNPNNPTGQLFSGKEIETILSSCEDSLLIMDEAYISFVEERGSAARFINRGDVVILRSMTKDYALAGLRLGYAIAGEDIIKTLRRVCPSWNVNMAAQKAGIAAISAAGYLERCLEKINKSRDYLITQFSRLGMPPLPSKANFFLVKVGNGRLFREALLKKSILVRDCASFGLSEYIRIAPRTLSECRKMIVAIREISNPDKPEPKL